VQPKPGAPTWLGLSPVIWLLLGGGGAARLPRMEKQRRPHGVLDPAMLRVKLLPNPAFFFQYLLPGLFFAPPSCRSRSGLRHRHRADLAVDHR
jgi:hypothetical protein